MGCKAKTTGLKSPRRRRTERDAIAVLNGAEWPLRGPRRKHAFMRIWLAKQPVVEAQRIVAHLARDVEAGNIDADAVGPGVNAVGYDDVQELRAELIWHRRKSGHDGLSDVHRKLLADMDRQITTRGMTRGEFDERASRVRAMSQALPQSAQIAA